ncbi:MAG: hypothetical protein B7Z72_10945 [Gemmatimonadetes bacterium 21-71-4]|nr:MAG: hypothetical protein B7Z72_10945 [Gemmatimonadetes bacterium 21-71-4]
MTNKQLVRLAGLLAAVVVAWGVLALARRHGADRPEGLTLVRIDTAAVDTIAFTTAHDTAVLARSADGTWRVNGHRAMKGNVQQLLAALRDTTTWSELAAESRASHAAMGVSADSGQRVRIAGHGGPLLDLVTGHQTMDATGLYVRRSGSDPVYTLHGSLVAALTHALSEWRDKTIASVAPDSVEKIEVSRGREAYALVRAGKGWRLAGGAAADSSAVASLLNQYHPLAASGFATAAQADSASFVHPSARVRFFGKGATPLLDLAIDSTKSGVWARTGAKPSVFEFDFWQLVNVAPTKKSVTAGVKKPV